MSIDRKATTTATLYHVPKTISSPIVQCLLELDLVGNTVDIEEKQFVDLKKEDYLGINPMGTSPTFQDGPIVIWESGAILDYLLERYDTNYILHPPPVTHQSSTQDAIEKRAKYQHVKQYIIATVYPFIASLTIHKLFKPVHEHDPAYIASATEKVNGLLIPALEMLLGVGPFFLGQEMSAVDLVVAKPLKNLEQLGLLVQSFKLQELFNRISSLDSFEQAYSSVSEHRVCRRDLVLVPSDSKEAVATA